jgi:8-oxo-dGTP diphosphatase
MHEAAIHVAVGVIWADGKILITQRAKQAHQGGFWEFPGGKLEPGESVQSALRRELQEEVGILVQDSTPLIKIDYRYPDKRVILDVWHVHAFGGTAAPHEGQPMRWVAPQQLQEFAFPAANQAIIKAVMLPDSYAILEGSDRDQIEQRLQRIIANRVSMLQLRIKALPSNELARVYALVADQCRNSGIRLFLNSDLPLANATADGLHLSSRSLLASSSRPGGYQWIGASCHNLNELQHAERIGVDFAVLAPVLPTTTHPNAVPLGWQGFSELVEQVNIPVYALGGLGTAHLQQALSAGAQGIAGISAFL